MSALDAASAPVYTDDVPAPVIPSNGQADKLALRFEGGHHCITTIAKPINNCLTSSFTLEVSFKPDEVGNDAWHTMLVRESFLDDGTSDAPIMSLTIRGDGRLMFQFRDKSSIYRQIKSAAPISAGCWYHAAIIATPSQAALFVKTDDGNGYVLVGKADVEGGGPLFQGPEHADYDSAWTIGRGMWSRDPDEWFVGTIDEVRLTNQALKPAQLLWFDQPVPGDLDGDLDVDATDGAMFQNCMTGPNLLYTGSMPSNCTLATDAQGLIAADIDRDGDVDQADFAVWQLCFSGTDKPGNPKCNS